MLGEEHERDRRTQPESHAPAPVRIARLWWVVSAGTALALVVLLGLVIAYRKNREPFGFEIEFMRSFAVIVWAPFAYPLYREHRLPHPPIWHRVRAP